ncbi:uncharacterized protein E5676_scaffold225G00710 [Cucumis melo var. makuwa]|uniref:Uncharacterized protein n=1 Tax=Cucumis melo var. makuwa TaxID=1194695 RepID=A0A5D3DWN4_CUCMM|nr:uncharacterized protein E5676_scaffold225G00710 [Cucumis melo var. makuwa]
MFQENPNNNSLSSILPCEQLLTAKSVLTDVNTQIAISYPDIALVCNPFSQPPYYEYQPQNCAANTIRIGDIPKKSIGLGSFEELRYPAHPFADGIPEIVEFHCYDKYM